MQAVIFVGIQESGKSSFYFERFRDTHLRLNLDMLKTRNRERILVQACLAAKYAFVVDNTNVTTLDRARYIEPAHAARFRVIGFYFDSALRDARRRNRQRPGRQLVPEVAIAATYRRLQVPMVDEGFDELYRVRIAGTEFVVAPLLGRA